MTMGSDASEDAIEGPLYGVEIPRRTGDKEPTMAPDSRDSAPSARTKLLLQPMVVAVIG